MSSSYSALDVLSRLCQVEHNEDFLNDNLEDKVYEDIASLLTVHDIQLIVCSLEALYQLSELGEVTTTHIAAVKTAVATLVNLVTVEAQSYGPQSLIGIKVVEQVTAATLAERMSAKGTSVSAVTPSPSTSQRGVIPTVVQQTGRPVAVPTPPLRKCAFFTGNHY